MKKLKVWLAVLVTLIVGVCCLVACGDSKVEGTYKLYSATTMGQEVKVKDSMGLFTEDSVVVTLNEDGTAKLTLSAMGSSNAADGTWEKSEEDGEVSIVISGYSVKYSSGKLIVTINGVDGVSYTLKK